MHNAWYTVSAYLMQPSTLGKEVPHAARSLSSGLASLLGHPSSDVVSG